MAARMFLLPAETHPITQEQLVNEIEGIYAGLRMVEKKCVEIDQQQSSTTHKLSDEQWQTLTALYRTLLHEHHDFFLASQDPSSFPALRRLAAKYAMPARMWHHGIHSYLELLRHRLPDLLEHLLTLVYISLEHPLTLVYNSLEHPSRLVYFAYLMLALHDLPARMLRHGIHSYLELLRHRLPDSLEYPLTLVYFAYLMLALCKMPARMLRHGIYSSFELLRHRLPDSLEHTLTLVYDSLKHPLTLVYFAYSMMGLLGESVSSFEETWIDCLGGLACYCIAIKEIDLRDYELWSGIARMWYNKAAGKFPNVGRIQHHLPVLARQNIIQHHSPVLTRQNIIQQLFYHSKALVSVVPFLNARESVMLLFTPFLEVSEIASQMYPSAEASTNSWGRHFRKTIAVPTQCTGNTKILPFRHTVLSYLHGLTDVPDAPRYIKAHILWERLSALLIPLDNAGVRGAPFVGRKGLGLSTGRHIPEDFVMTGLIWAQQYFPQGICECRAVEEEEREWEFPSLTAPRTEWRLWLGVRLALLNAVQDCRRGWCAYLESIYGYAGTIFENLKAVTKLAQRISAGWRLMPFLCCLPQTHAAPVGERPLTDDRSSLEGSYKLTSLSHIADWIAAILLASLVTFLGLRGSPKGQSHYCVLSFGASVASLILLDAGAIPEVRWPTLAVGSIFLLQYWRKIFDDHTMGLGWLPVVLGLGLVLDASLVNLTAGTQGTNQGLFPQLLLSCLWLSLSGCSGVAWIAKNVRFTRTP